ncbi:DNA polymerase IV [soil metagenome]
MAAKDNTRGTEDLIWMSLDMNSYFASVEQQFRPELRSLPVAVVPVMAENTCAIAASYEAKRYGIKTGTKVFDARRLCPGLEVVEARPPLYVQTHEKIVEAVDSVLPVHKVTSIDEMFCKMGLRQREPEKALAVARDVKEAIHEQVGAHLLCSIGLAPNRFLAKIAGKMRKPDGLTALRSEDLPHKLYPLSLRDLTGIGSRMHARLERAGVYTVEQLCAQSKDQLRHIWKGVVGERWWYALRGHDLPESPTRRRTLGHSHVLHPEFRTPEGAKAVLVRLVHKAAARLRKLGYWAGGMSVRLSYTRREKWKSSTPLPPCQDTQTMIQALSKLWKRCPEADNPLKVSVVFHDLVDDACRTPPLFVEDPRKSELTRAMDTINGRFGANAVYLAAMHRSVHTAPSRIAFTRIPDIAVETTRGVEYRPSAV